MYVAATNDRAINFYNKIIQLRHNDKIFFYFLIERMSMGFILSSVSAILQIALFRDTFLYTETFKPYLLPAPLQSKTSQPFHTYSK